MDQTIKFRLADRMRAINFASAPEMRRNRESIISNFIERYYPENPHFEEWLDIAENNPGIINRGAFFRAMIIKGEAPNKPNNNN